MGVVAGDEEEEVGSGGGSVVGFMMVGDLLLFCVASRGVMDLCDGERAVVFPVTMRAATAVNMIAYTLLSPRWIAAYNEEQ